MDNMDELMKVLNELMDKTPPEVSDSDLDQIMMMRKLFDSAMTMDNDDGDATAPSGEVAGAEGESAQAEPHVGRERSGYPFKAYDYRVPASNVSDMLGKSRQRRVQGVRPFGPAQPEHVPFTTCRVEASAVQIRAQ